MRSIFDLPYDMSGYPTFASFELYYANLREEVAAARREVERAFEAARHVDAGLASKVASAQDSAAAAGAALRMLAGCFGAVDGGAGVPLLLAGPEAAAGALRLATGARFSWIDADGNVSYNWPEIMRVLGKGAGDILPGEYRALAELYVGMGVRDTTLFLHALADRTADFEWRPLSADGVHSPPSFSLWRFDPVKTGNLLAFVDAMQILQGYRLMEGGLSKEEERSLRDEWFLTLQKKQMLSFLDGLTGLTGASGAGGPSLTVAESPRQHHCYELTFSVTGMDVLVPDSPGLQPAAAYDHRSYVSVHFTEPMDNPFQINAAFFPTVEEYYESLTQFVWLEKTREFAVAGSVFAVELAVGILLEGNPVFAGVTAAVIAAVMFGTGTIDDYIKETEAARLARNVRDHEAVGMVVRPFRLVVTGTTNAGTLDMSYELYPTADTYEYVERLNAAIADGRVVGEAIDVTDVLLRPEVVASIVSGMDKDFYYELFDLQR